MHFMALCSWWLHSRCLLNPCQSDIWWLTTLGGIPTNLYLSVSTISVPSWRRGFLSWPVEYVSPKHYCQAEVFCSWYVQIVEPLQSLQAWPTWLVELFDEYPAPFSPEMTMIVIVHDTNIYIEWHSITNGSRKKHQSLLLRGIGSSPGPLSPPSCSLSWLGD